MQTDPFRKRLTTFSVGLPRTVCSFVCDFIALEIMASELVALHDDNFCKFHVSYACISDTCAVDPRRRFVTERGKRKESRNLNPGCCAWVISVLSFFIQLTTFVPFLMFLFSACKDHDRITRRTVSNNVSIGYFAFHRKTGLQSVQSPSSLKKSCRNW